jgi:hypothetical protein
MTSAPFIAFLERKLIEAGVTKFVPPAEVLAAQFARAQKMAALSPKLREILDRTDGETPAAPAGLAERVRQHIEGSDTPWDTAVWEIVLRERASG